MASGEDSYNCFVCSAKAEHICGNCRIARYCSRTHQKSDWKNHKAKCFPCRIEQSKKLGRHLVATRKITAGDVIFTDSPVAVGPKQVTQPLCLACFSPVDGSYNCPSCGWPLCGPKCKSMPTHLPECKLSQKRESRIKVSNFDQDNPMYECITPLRCLWLRDNFPERWEKIIAMEAHTQQRRKTEKYKLNQINVVNFIRDFLKLKSYSEDLIHFVCGVLEVNGFEIPGPGIIGLYPFGCLLEHSCIPNTTRTFNSKLHLVVRAAVDIEAGSHITTSYTDTLWGVRDRRFHLINSKYFVCNCQRCRDPTDMRTHLSSLRCKVCPEGLLSPPEDPQAPWICDSCGGNEPSNTVDDILRKYGEKLISLQGRINQTEKFLKDTAKVLSENHQYRSETKLALAQIYGREGPNSMREISHDILQRKILLCKELLVLANTLAPGYSPLRGAVLYELQASLYEQYLRLRKKHQQGTRGSTLLQEIKYALEEAVKILRSDSHLQEEVHVAVQAEDDLKKLNSIILKRN